MMFGPPRPQLPNMRRGYHHSPHNPQWRQPNGPRVNFRGQHQRFIHPRPPFQSGNDNYWCETCDRGFPTENVLNKHKQQHQKCNIDGCQFIAHPKVITKHIQMQHSTGLYKKIANIKNPEEIEKWREERRRKYPTKVNIDKKAAQLIEKIDRGEKMGLERDRNHHNKQYSEQHNKSGQGVKRKFESRNQNQPKSKFKKSNSADNNKITQPKAKPKPAPIIVEDKRLQPFAGILNLQMDSDNEIENDCVELNGLIEDEDDCEKFKGTDLKKISDSSEPVVCGALSSLMCDYGSSEEEDSSEGIMTNPKNKTQSSTIIQNRNHSVLQKPYHVIKPSRAESGSLAIITSDARELINLNNEVHNPSTDKGNVIIRHGSEETKDSSNLVQIANKNNRSNNLQKKPMIKEVIVTSTSVDNKEINKDNSSDSGPEVKTKMGKTASSSEGSKNIKCEDEIKNDPVQKTIHNDSDSGPEEVTAEIRKEDTLTGLDETKRKDVKKNIKKRQMQTINQHRRPKLPSTLLQKLLYREMQQERNIVLQCIRYIRRNNYFDNK